MWILEMLSLLALAMLDGMKTEYGIRLNNERDVPFTKIWRGRGIYLWAVVWLVIFSGVRILTGGNIRLIRMMDLAITYVILAFLDLKWRIVPDWILVCYLAGQLLFGAFSTGISELLRICFTGGIFGAALWAFSHFSGEKMGQGDVKLLCATAMTAGWAYAFQVFALGLVLSFLFSIYLILFRRKSVKTEIPFVPFLAAGNGILLALATFG